MKVEEAWVGAMVRVSDGHRRPELGGMIGVVERIYVSSARTALHVRLEDGRWQLFFPWELEEPGVRGRTP